MWGLVVNALPIILSETRGEFLCVQIGENILVPRIISGDEEEIFIW